MAQYEAHNSGASRDHEDDQNGDRNKFQSPQVSSTHLRQGLVWLVMIILVVLAIRKFDVLGMTMSNGWSRLRAPARPPRMFGDIEFSPGERFDIDNVKYVWMILVAVLVVVSAIIGTG